MKHDSSRSRKTESLFGIHCHLKKELRNLEFGPPVTHVYNPLEYAALPLREYLELFGAGTREIVLLGMNPGPFGMAQTGVPFGDPVIVREWLRIEAPVGKPEKEHPKRPIGGFLSSRREISGQRLWGWARDRFVTPERFFERFFVLNYCPLVFMEETGKNRTPDKLPAGERGPLFDICDRALQSCVRLLSPRIVVGIGAFAENRARAALSGNPEIRIGRVLHPSPASPAANGGWARAAERDLEGLGIQLQGSTSPKSAR